MPNWIKTTTFQGAPSGAVNAQTGVIEGVSVCTVGEAKGHGVNLEGEFIDSVVEFGNQAKAGLKARFGHPNMCDTALGTFLGRFKNFRREGDIAKADLFLSNSAKTAPKGDLYSYVIDLADTEADMFGTSIVFEHGDFYHYDEDGEKVDGFNSDGDTFATMASLHACDVVDEPAANDGLFSAFSGETLSGRVTEFFDQYPEVMHALTSEPEILQIALKHRDEIEPFLDRYREELATQTITKRAEPRKDESPVKDQNTTDESVEETAPAETTEATETQTEETSEQAESSEQEDTAETVEETTEALGARTIDAQEFKRACDEFGAEAAAEAFNNGGGYEDAQSKAFASLKAEVQALKAGKPTGTPAAQHSEPPKQKRGMFNTEKK